MYPRKPRYFGGLKKAMIFSGDHSLVRQDQAHQSTGVFLCPSSDGGTTGFRPSRRTKATGAAGLRTSRKSAHSERGKLARMSAGVTGPCSRVRGSRAVNHHNGTCRGVELTFHRMDAKQVVAIALHETSGFTEASSKNRWWWYFNQRHKRSPSDNLCH